MYLLEQRAWACADVRSLWGGKRRHGGPAPGPFSEVHTPLPRGKGSALRGGGGSSRGLALGLSLPVVLFPLLLRRGPAGCSGERLCEDV